jgi:integrase
MWIPAEVARMAQNEITMVDTGSAETVQATSLAPVTPESADRHPVLVYLARLAPGSRRTMRGALETTASILTSGACNAVTMPWHQLRYQHTAALRAELADRYASATANKILAALRGVLKEAWRLGYMTAEDYQRAADVGVVSGNSLPRGRALSHGDLSALIAVCAKDSRPSGIRDAAMIALLYIAGLRRSEAVHLTLADYERESGGLTIRKAKGNKTRIVYIANGAIKALDAWIAVRGDEPGPLFFPVTRYGVIATHEMTDQSVMMALRRRAKQAGVAPFTPHDLRRTMISDLLDAGVDIVTVQKLAGHSQVQTTAKYDRRGEEVKRIAAELLDIV